LYILLVTLRFNLKNLYDNVREINRSNESKYSKIPCQTILIQKYIFMPKRATTQRIIFSTNKSQLTSKNH